MDSLILRSKTVRRKISDENNLAEQVKQLLPLLPEIDENKNLPIKMRHLSNIILQCYRNRCCVGNNFDCGG